MQSCNKAGNTQKNVHKIKSHAKALVFFLKSKRFITKKKKQNFATIKNITGAIYYNNL